MRMMDQIFRSKIQPTPIPICTIPQKNIIHPRVIAASVRFAITSQSGSFVVGHSKSESLRGMVAGQR